jgi:hypothetical protein
MTQSGGNISSIKVAEAVVRRTPVSLVAGSARCASRYEALASTFWRRLLFCSIIFRN